MNFGIPKMDVQGVMKTACKKGVEMMESVVICAKMSFVDSAVTMKVIV